MNDYMLGQSIIRQVQVLIKYHIGCSCCRLYPKKLSVSSLTHFAAPGRATYNEAIREKFVETQVGCSFGPT